MCGGTTGHAEAVLVEFDPTIISYRRLIELFWRMHDYTRAARRGPADQYRNAIFYMSDEQRQVAEESRDELQQTRRSARPITTLIQPAGTFWKAEEYHQRYYEKHGYTACRT